MLERSGWQKWSGGNHMIWKADGPRTQQFGIWGISFGILESLILDADLHWFHSFMVCNQLFNLHSMTLVYFWLLWQPPEQPSPFASICYQVFLSDEEDQIDNEKKQSFRSLGRWYQFGDSSFLKNPQTGPDIASTPFLDVKTRSKRGGIVVGFRWPFYRGTMRLFQGLRVLVAAVSSFLPSLCLG